MRVTADGARCEVAFTLRRQATVNEGDFERDADPLLSDLVKLERTTERSSRFGQLPSGSRQDW